MTHLNTYEDVQALWDAWSAHRAVNPQEAPSASLRRVLHAHGSFLAQQEIEFAFAAAFSGQEDERARSSFEDCAVVLLGGRALRVRHAFSTFDRHAAGRIRTQDFMAAAKVFAQDDAALARVAEELDKDGDTWIELDDFLSYLPSARPAKRRYSASHVDRTRIGAGADKGTPAAGAPVRPQAAAMAANRAQVGAGSKHHASISPLQLRIAFFRMLQGAAYRSFRENYSANSETHLRARDLPYSITDFSAFVSATIEYYLSLGVVQDAECIAEFRRLDEMVSGEVEALQTRVRNWAHVKKTPAMLAAQQAIEAERAELQDHAGLFEAIIEFILALRHNGVDLEHVDEHVLARHELNRLRRQELHSEMSGSASTQADADEHAAWLESWTRVILTSSDERVDGAIMPVRFWYERFMPQLLRCASITTRADLEALDQMTSGHLDAWHADMSRMGAFDRYGLDVKEGFAACTAEQKQALRQAWLLTEHYLNGVEKRREREEFGRESGSLSEYVAFIDVYVGRNSVAQSEMRVSFPYFIGPAVWCFLHTSAEIVESMDDEARAQSIIAFKAFFRCFATMYACPYCRYHLNRYVVRNREVNMYPVEYLLLGGAARAMDLAVSMDEKLATISAERPGSLRLFLWKLHNAVSSSIARTEPWFRKDPKPIYTTRFWPGLDSELARAHALGKDAVELHRLTDIYSIMKPAARLAVLRDELDNALQAVDHDAFAQVTQRAHDEIADLEEAVHANAYLQLAYAFDPAKQDAPPHFTHEEEAFALSGIFVER